MHEKGEVFQGDIYRVFLNDLSSGKLTISRSLCHGTVTVTKDELEISVTHLNLSCIPAEFSDYKDQPQSTFWVAIGRQRRHHMAS